MELKIGDIISFQYDDVPLPEIQAAVIEDHGEIVEVMSTLLIAFQHSGDFERSKMKNLRIIRSAIDAIPLESKRGWRQGQLLKAIGGLYADTVATLVAAFDGFCVCKMDKVNGKWLVGGAKGFVPV